MSYDVDAIRAEFPALGQLANGAPVIRFDNPAGTQVPQRVIDRMVRCMSDTNANLGGFFATSRQAGELIDLAHEWAADFVNAVDPGEILFGPNMTSITFALTRSLAPEVQPGQRIVLTRSDHDGNVAPWLILAEERNLEVAWIDLDPDTYEPDLSDLDTLISTDTKIVAVNHANNVTGTITDVATIAARAKQVGAWVYVDSVQYAPHGIIDVQGLDCDFLVCSAYKFYGPHIGLMWGRRELLERLRAYKVRPASVELPSKFVTGTTNRESIAGALGALEHFAWVGKQFGDSCDGRNDQQRSLRAGLAVMQQQDRALTERLIAGLQEIGGVRIVGITSADALDRRVSTVSYVQEGVHPDAVAQAMAERGIYLWSGHNYGVETVQRLGLADSGGVVRVGPVHYNTLAEVDRFVTAYGEWLSSN